MGFKVFFYLIILLTLVYFSKQKVWSRFGSKADDDEEEGFDKDENKKKWRDGFKGNLRLTFDFEQDT